MADLTITASAVVPGASAKIDRSGTAGATFSAGDMLYKSGTTWLKTDADDSTTDSTKAAAVGMALTSALIIGSPVAVATSGSVTVGSVLTKGTIYILSGAAGLICPAADKATNDWVTIVGVAESATSLVLDISATAILSA